MSERDYKKLIDEQLSNILNASFNIQVLTKIDKYIENPLGNDIVLDVLERAFTGFFENSSTNNFTSNSFIIISI